MALKTGNPVIDALGGTAWIKNASNTSTRDGGLILTFAFGTGSGGAWTAFEQSQFWWAVKSWTAVANIHVMETNKPSSADLLETKQKASSWDDPKTSMIEGATTNGSHQTFTASSSQTSQLLGRYNVENDWNTGSLMQGGKKFGTFVHEIGHALGLDHPHEAEAGKPAIPAPPSGAPSLDHRNFTIMSYNGRPKAADHGQAAGPMALDIAAIQLMYGAVKNNDGDTVYMLKDKNAAGTFYQTIWDTSGTDTIRYDGSGDATIDLRAASLANDVGGGGFLSSVKVGATQIKGGYYIAADATGFIPDRNGDWGVIIENATGGSGNDTLVGNGVGNVLRGNGGRDHMNGFGGNDTMIGGQGDDEYVVDQAGDIVVEFAGEGIDKIYTGLNTVNLSSMSVNVENLQFVGVGNFNGTGNALGNAIVGSGGNDTLNGSGGRDDLVGGKGNDLYQLFDVTNGAYDAIYEDAGSGMDTVYVRQVSSAVKSYTMANNVEQGVINDPRASGFTLIGNAQNNKLFDDSGANHLQGGAGHDELNGGAGLDFLSGGANDDTYYLQDRTGGWYDLVLEDAGGGTDRVIVTPITTATAISSYALTSNVENGELVGNAAFTLVGNSINNRLFGNSGNNTLMGGDGADSLSGEGGLDKLYGGFGDDKFYLSDRTGGSYDSIVESAGGGTDTVYVSAITGAGMSSTYWLDGEVENGVLSGSAGFGLVGNALSNHLTGHAGNDSVYGGGGNDFIYTTAGADIMDGGAGFDTIVFSKAMIADWQSGRLDADIARDSFASWEALRGSNGNDVIRTNSWGYAVTLEGEGGDDVLAAGVTGFTADRLDGGLGNDMLSGGAGSDVFVFDTALNGRTNVDRITDFAVRSDKIYLENTGSGLFEALANGTLATGAFNIGSAATQADDRIVYNTGTGALLYDSDGTGAAAATQFAILDNKPVGLSAADFLII